MNSNDKLLRLRYAIDLRDTDLVKAFELSGVPLTEEEAQAALTKVQSKNKDNAESSVYERTINNRVFDVFLNSLTPLARGPQKDKPTIDTPQRSREIGYINGMLLKKLKVALSMATDDTLDVFTEAGVYPSKDEIGVFLRKEGRQNFKPCGDKYMRNFLRGLGIYN